MKDRILFAMGVIGFSSGLLFLSVLEYRTVIPMVIWTSFCSLCIIFSRPDK